MVITTDNIQMLAPMPTSQSELFKHIFSKSAPSTPVSHFSSLVLGTSRHTPQSPLSFHCQIPLSWLAHCCSMWSNSVFTFVFKAVANPSRPPQNTCTEASNFLPISSIFFVCAQPNVKESKFGDVAAPSLVARVRKEILRRPEQLDSCFFLLGQ